MNTRKLSKHIDDPVYAAFLLADRNIGAQTVLYCFVQYMGSLEHLYGSRHSLQKSMMKKLEALDRFRLHGSAFWDFYKDTCKTSVENLLAFTHAYVDRERYAGTAPKLNEWYENGTPFDFPELFEIVKRTDPQLFGELEVIEADGEPKEITPDLLAALKNKFAK